MGPTASRLLRFKSYWLKQCRPQGERLLMTEAQGLGNPGLGAAGWSRGRSAEAWGWLCPLRPYSLPAGGTSRCSASEHLLC